MRVEHEYERGGALQYLAAWDVRRGQVLGRCEERTGIEPFGRLVEQVMKTEPYLTFRTSGVDYPRISLRAKSGGLQRRRSCNRRRYWTARLPSQMAVAGLFAQASQASSRPKSSAQSAARG